MKRLIALLALAAALVACTPADNSGTSPDLSSPDLSSPSLESPTMESASPSAS